MPTWATISLLTSLLSLDSEALDFRAASESFAAIRKLARRDLETLGSSRNTRARSPRQWVGGMILFGRDREHHFPDAWTQAGRLAGLVREIGTAPQAPKRRYFLAGRGRV